MNSILRILCSVWLLSVISLQAEPAEARPLTTIAAVKSLPIDEAAKRIPIRIQAQIIGTTPSNSGIIIHQNGVGIYVVLNNALRKITYKQGDQVLVSGHTLPGGYLPSLQAKNLQILKETPQKLPQPIILTRENIFTPQMDCQWVTCRGVITGTAYRGLVFTLKMNCEGEEIEFSLPHTPANIKRGNALLYSEVSATGPLCTFFNKQRQLIGRRVNLESSKDITLIPYDATQNYPVTPIHQITLQKKQAGDPVLIRGIVTCQNDKKVYVQGKRAAIALKTLGEEKFQPGQEVEAFGFVLIEPFGPALRTQSIKVLGQQELPKPIVLTSLDQEDRSKYHNTLTSVKATLLNKRKTTISYVLYCSLDGQVFEAIAPKNSPAIDKLIPNSEIRIQGVCELITKQDTPSAEADGFQIIIPHSDNIVVLSTPPWWTAEKISILLVSVLVITCFSLIWGWLLRKKVSEQTSTIGAQIEREAVLRERQKLARELHDSVEQNMSSLAIQVDNALVLYKRNETEKLDKSLTLTKKMLNHCQRESRESIYDLRSGSEPHFDSAWHDELLLSEASLVNAHIETSHAGKDHLLGKSQQQHIKKIIRESVYNALRHGKAKLVKIHHENGSEKLVITVTDDGCGFDTKNSLPDGHFGILGMQERAERIGGSLAIHSQINLGTEVTITIPKVSKDS